MRKMRLEISVRSVLLLVVMSFCLVNAVGRKKGDENHAISVKSSYSILPPNAGISSEKKKKRQSPIPEKFSAPDTIPSALQLLRTFSKA